MISIGFAVTINYGATISSYEASLQIDKFMKIKLTILFAFAGLSLLSAKSFPISLANKAKVGNLQLQPGNYDVSVDGSKVKFTDARTRKSVETDATVQTAEKKFATTQVDVEGAGDASKINEIDFGGTTTKLVFQ
jgi:hypothetical protein